MARTEIKHQLIAAHHTQSVVDRCGHSFIKTYKPLLSEWDDIHRQLLDYQSQPQGTLVVALPPNIAGTSAFIQVLQQFSERYPLIDLQLVTIHEALSLIDKKIDVLLGPEKYLLEPQNTIGATLFNYSYQCFASPAYLSKHGKPVDPSELCAHNCLTYNTDSRWQFNELTTAVSGTLRTDSGDSLIGAARMGMGIIHIPRFMVQEEIQRGELQQILNAFQGKHDRFMAFYAKHDYKPRKIAVFIEFLLGYFVEKRSIAQ